MTHTVTELNVNIENYPQVDASHPLDASKSITMGDLHGNALKLIWTLIKQNAMELQPVGSLTKPEEIYKRLVDIYNKGADQLTKDDLNEFNAIIKAAKINQLAAVRIIGDELADRGQNDYFTLKMLEKLGMAGVKTEVLLSNHSAEFLDDYTRKTLSAPQERYVGQENGKSLYGLSTLIQKGLVDEDEIQKIVEFHYKPNLKAISYSIDRSTEPTKLTLYTHAPVGLETIKAAAALYKIDYKDDSIEALTKTIDQINECFYEDIDQNSIHKHHQDFLSEREFALGQTAIPSTNPLLRLMWNRGDIDQAKQEQQIDGYGITLPEEQHGYQLALVHGHDGPSHRIFQDKYNGEATQSYLPNMRNTDNDVGKRGPGGDYHIMLSDDQVALTPNLAIKSKNPRPILLPLRIEDIYCRTQQSLKAELSKKMPTDERQFHELFMEAQKIKWATLGNEDLRNKFGKERTEATVVNWFTGLDQIPKKKEESLVDYSIRLAESSSRYKGEFEQFKSEYKERHTKNLFQTQEGNKIAQETLRDIKTLIEKTDWKLGIWGSSSKIKVDGVSKQVPSHAYEIYKQCLKAEKSPETAMQALEEIHKISNRAMQPKSTAFKQFRERHQSTLESYKAINEQSEKLFSFKMN